MAQEHTGKSKTISEDIPPKSKRRHAPKVRTGCLTCKKRRVKCDEAKPHCKRCVTARTTCDGYAKPLSPKKVPRPLAQRRDGLSQIIAAAVIKDPRFQTDLELRYFNAYKNRFSHQLGGSFPSRIWGTIIPQAGEEDPYVLHMILAISAELCSRQALKNHDTFEAANHHDISLRQYHDAIQLSKSQETAISPRLSIISLLLQTCYEALIGNVLICLDRAQAGLDLIETLLAEKQHDCCSRTGNDLSDVKTVDNELLLAASFFDLQLLQHYDSRSAETHRRLRFHDDETITRMPNNFTDVEEARAYCMLLQRRSSHFVWEMSSTTVCNAVCLRSASDDGHVPTTFPCATSSSIIPHLDHTSAAPLFPPSDASWPHETRSRGTSLSSLTYDDSYERRNSYFTDSHMGSPRYFSTPLDTSLITLDDSSLLDPYLLDFDIPTATIKPDESCCKPRVIPHSSISIPPTRRSDEIMADYKKFSEESRRWRLSFSHLYSRLKKSPDATSVIAANTLFVQSIAADIELSRVLSLTKQTSTSIHIDITHLARNSNTLVSPNLTPNASLNDYREIVNTCREIVQAKKRQEEENDHRSLDSVFEIGITQALYIVIQYCPNETLRDEALRILKGYGVKEGAWDCVKLVTRGGDDAGV